MKKIILWLLFIFSIFFIYLSPVSAIAYNSGITISKNLNLALKWTQLVPWDNVKINSWFKDSILKWVENLSIFLSIMAVGSIVYWAFMLTISAWEDERIKKWKDIVKWWMIWFLAIISAGWLIAVVINFVYTVAN